MTDLVLDADVQVLAGGRVLLGGDPPRLLRLRTATPVWSTGSRTPNEHALARRLLDGGFLHPLPQPGPADVTVVVPVRDRTGALAVLLARLAGQAPVVVVDDGSQDGEAVAAVCAQHGARRVRLDPGRGPGAARNAGLAEVTTAFVALLDSDCTPPPGWLPALLGHVDDAAVVAVAPRVRARAAPGLLGRYAHARGPLDLGPRPARVRPGSRVAYVPTAALLVRRSALPPPPVFDPALRYGEDVDLVWRLHDAGGTVRYDPTVVVLHDEPGRWRDWLLRRHRYGGSAGPLAARHGVRLAPLVVSPWPAASLALLLAGLPALALAAAAVPAARLHRTLVRADVTSSEAVRAAVRTTVRGLLATVSGLGGPGAVLTAPVLSALLLPRRTRPAAAALLLLPPLLDHLERHPAVDLVRWTGLRLLDDLAYASGVWRGCWSARCVGALRPRTRRPA